MKSCVTISLVTEARGGPFILWGDLAEACREAQRLGFEAVEIFAPSAQELAAPVLRQVLGDSGLALAAVGTGAGWVKHKLHLALPEAGQRRQARDFIRTLIEAGAALGAPAIIGSMQGRSGEGVDKATARGYLVEGLSELAQVAQGAGVPLLYEPLNRYETDQANTVAAGSELVQATGCGNLKLLCDLFHMNIEEAELGAALRSAGPLLGHVHFVDSNRRPVGCGHLNVAEAVAALRAIGYQGYLSAEALPYPTPSEAAQQTMRAFRYFCRT